MSEFGRVCERRKLRINVGKSKVTRYSGYGTGGSMHVILNGEKLENVDCIKYLVWRKRCVATRWWIIKQ